MIGIFRIIYSCTYKAVPTCSMFVFAIRDQLKFDISQYIQYLIMNNFHTITLFIRLKYKNIELFGNIIRISLFQITIYEYAHFLKYTCLLKQSAYRLILLLLGNFLWSQKCKLKRISNPITNFRIFSLNVELNQDFVTEHNTTTLTKILKKKQT